MLHRKAILGLLAAAAVITTTATGRAQTAPNILAPVTVNSTGSQTTATQTQMTQDQTRGQTATSTTSTAAGTSTAPAPTVYPSQVPFVLNDGAALTVSNDVLRVRGKVEQSFGPSKVQSKMSQVVVRGSLQVQSDGTNNNGQITWTSVQRPDTGAVAILSAPLASKFSTASQSLDAGQKLNAAGDTSGLVDAVGVLYGVQTPAPTAASTSGAAQPRQTTEQTTTAAAPPQGGSSTGASDLQMPGQDAPQGGVSGSSTSPLSSGNGSTTAGTQFKTPDKVEVGGSSTPSDVIGTTADGCTPQIDTANNQVTLTSQLTKNGAPSGDCTSNGQTLQLQKSYSGCSAYIANDATAANPTYRRYYVKDGTPVYIDTECQVDTTQRYEFQKAFASCTDKVDRTNNVAYSQYERYYIDGSGNTQMVDSTCQPDTDNPLTMAEDQSRCTWNADLSTMKATPRAELVYTDRNGNRVVVTSCVTTTTSADAVDIVQSQTGCGLRNDFTAGISYVQAKDIYTKPDGTQVTAADCADTGEQLTQQVDTEGCDVQVDQTNGVAIPRGATYVTQNGQPTYLTTCQALTDQAVNLQTTTQGCESTFVHDIPSGKSYGTEKVYYQLAGDPAPTYVSDCQQDTGTIYTQQTRITGYQNDDTTRTSLPLTEVYIDTPIGKVVVSPAQVASGAQALAYTYVDQETSATGTVTYQGCDKYVDQANYDVYTRPDNSTYKEQTGTAAPVGPSQGCKVTTWPTSWPLDHTSVSAPSCTFQRTDCGRDGDQTCTMTSTRPVKTGHYTGHYVVTREDGTVVSDVSGTKTSSVSGSCDGSGNGTTSWAQSYLSVPNSVGGAAALQWNQQEGWVYY